MSYTSSSNFDLSLSASNGTAKPGNPFYCWKNFSFEPQGPTLYRLNMPLLFDQHLEITPFIDNSWQEDAKFNSCLNDALKRYREINNGAVFDLVKVNSFLQILKNVCNKMELHPYIMFNKFAAKIQMVINNREFVLDYDHEDPDNVFILSSMNGTICVKESKLEQLEETLRSF